MEFIKLETLDSVENAIMDFLPCFEHLTEKVDDIHSYSVKLFNFAEVYILENNSIRKGISVFYANDSEKHIGYISLIGIKQQYRKRGYGKKIIDFTHEVMKSKGMKYSKLEVDNDNNNAYNFYLHEGYSPDEKIASEKSIYLIKPL